MVQPYLFLKDCFEHFIFSQKGNNFPGNLLWSFWMDILSIPQLVKLEMYSSHVNVIFRELELNQLTSTSSSKNVHWLLTPGFGFLLMKSFPDMISDDI